MFSINLHGLELQDRRLEDGHLERLGKLCELWANYAPAVNLTAKIDESSLRAQLRASLLLVSLARDIGVQPGERWVDVGAGGGFPGLVVAATLGVALTLVEPRQRRAAFLEIALAAIGRGDCDVVRARLERKGWQSLERGNLPTRARVASSRATFAPPEWLSVGQRVIESDGVLFAHLRAGQEDPTGFISFARREHGPWSVRAYRP